MNFDSKKLALLSEYAYFFIKHVISLSAISCHKCTTCVLCINAQRVYCVLPHNVCVVCSTDMQQQRWTVRKLWVETWRMSRNINAQRVCCVLMHIMYIVYYCTTCILCLQQICSSRDGLYGSCG